MKKINKKLFDVMSGLTSIKKSGYNAHQKYHYPTEQDINEAIKPQLIKEKIAYNWSVEDVKLSDNNQFATVITIHSFVDLESGETLNIRSVGTGTDKQDKAIYKACTGAAKYAFSKLFMIATDDDPENDSSSKTTTKKTSGYATGNTKATNSSSFNKKTTNNFKGNGSSPKSSFGSALQQSTESEDYKNESF